VEGRRLPSLLLFNDKHLGVHPLSLAFPAGIITTILVLIYQLMNVTTQHRRLLHASMQALHRSGWKKIMNDSE
jgi:hypothetical protein